MSEITITVNNKTTNLQSFQIFNAPPQSPGAPGTVFVNTWGQAPDINGTSTSSLTGGGQAQFWTRETYYAICGNAPSALKKGLAISTKNYQTARLDDSNERFRLESRHPPGASPNLQWG
jgi:hypothetical protein